MTWGISHDLAENKALKNGIGGISHDVIENEDVITALP
jgi:hypothetical protein